MRRTVNQALHIASLDGDHDDLVLELPHPTHGYTEEHDQPEPHAVGRPRRRVRHWKQSFWKRRTAERRRKAAAYQGVLQEV